MPRTKPSSDYSARDITVLEGLEPVRSKPTMYIGSTDEYGLFQITKEAIDNSIDEFLAGHNKYVGVQIDGNAIRVWDNGRGIPVEKHPKTKVSTLQTVLTTLHAGGKIKDSKAYAAGSRGTHGVGISVTNALSLRLEVATYRRGQWWGQIFERGKPASQVAKIKSNPVVPTLKKGTLIAFQPDPAIFKLGVKLPVDRLKSLLELAAYLHPGLTLEFYQGSKRVGKFYQPKGVKVLLNKMLEDTNSEAIGQAPLSFQQSGLDVALWWSSHDEPNIQSYVCGSPTTGGGTHLRGLLNAIRDAIKPYKGKKNFRTEDLLVGLQGVLNLTIPSPEFESQTKFRLASEGAEGLVYNAVLPPLKKYFASNKAMVKQIVERAAAIREVNTKHQFDKKIAASLRQSSRGKSNLPTKLITAITAKPHQRELFLVEGESSKGSCKTARFSTFQEVLPLKGKPPNAYRKKNAINNEELRNILLSIGFDPSRKEPFEHLRCARVLLLSDEDSDGKHITVLVLSALHKYVPGLFDKKMVYVVEAPLFRGWYKGKEVWGPTLKYMQSTFKGINLKDISRLKGWGEASPNLLKHVAFEPKERVLWRVQPIKGKDLKEFLLLVGEGTEARKKLLKI